MEKNNIWSLYGLMAVFIILYGIFFNPPKNTLKYIWIIYIFMAPIIGFLMYS